MKRIITITLLIVFLLPMLAMSKGNEDSVKKYTQKQERFLKKIATFQKEKKEIPRKGSTSRIQYVFKDDLTRLYLVNSFLEHGENSLKINTLMYHMSYVNKFENEFPVTYTDILGNKHIFTKEGFIGQLKELLKSNDPSIQISTSRALIGLNYLDNEIFSLLKYYAAGTDIDNWDITNGARYINGITGASKKEWENPSKEKQDQCREDMRVMAIGAMDAINNNQYNDKIIVFFQEILSSNPTGFKDKLIKYLQRKNKQNIEDGSYNLFENSKLSKLSKEYLTIWKPDSSKSYCEKWYGPDSTYYNTDNYKTAYYNSDGSQCLIAGGLDLSNTSTTGIITNHPCGETTIINCDDLNEFLTLERDDAKSHTIDFTLQPTEIQENPHSQIPVWFRTGDIALLGISGYDNWMHTIINHEGNGTNARFACHSTPKNDKFLNFEDWICYTDGTNTGIFDYITFYHVIGSTVLEDPSEDSLTVAIGDTLNLKAMVTNNTEPTSLNEITSFKFDLKKKPENTVETLFSTASQPAADSTYVFDYTIAVQDTGRYFLIAETSYTEGTTIDSCILKIKAIPKITAPLPDSLYFVEPSQKGIVTDTLEVKVEVPQLVGGYPEIKIKIDDVYVTQGDIVFEDNLWVYYWDLSTLDPTEITGKKHSIKAEILGDPNCNTISGAMIVEGLICEDFEDFTFGEWTEWGGEWPLNSNEPWYIGTCPTNSAEKSLSSNTGYTTFSNYYVLSPNVLIPDSSENKTKMEFDIYWRYSGSLWSNLYMDICDSLGTPIVEDIFLPKFSSSWWRYSYDLSGYSGQTISIRLNNYHNWDPSSVIFTRYDIDDFLIYAIPDVEEPEIDFVFGNSAFVDEDMILSLEFNDESDISSAIAEYTIEGDSGTITLTPAKESYSYTGTILARDHECIGDIVFKIKDSVGNEIISDTYDIGWSLSSQILTAPENVQITMVNDSTVTLDWDIVAGASEYKVYISEDPYGGFALDTTGTFTASTQWQKNIDIDKKFYYIIAANSGKRKPLKEMKDLKIKGKKR
jgi:hypothetical protein